jgi:hypothetical protein
MVQARGQATDGGDDSRESASVKSAGRIQSTEEVV